MYFNKRITKRQLLYDISYNINRFRRNTVLNTYLE